MDGRTGSIEAHARRKPGTSGVRQVVVGAAWCPSVMLSEVDACGLAAPVRNILE